MVQSLSIIGVGAFGEFMLKHVTPYFKTRITDNSRDLSDLALTYHVDVCTLEEAAQADIVVIAVPVRAIEDVATKISPFLKPGQLVMDVASVKCLPGKVLTDNLPSHVDIVGLHPLFGPQSGKHGIHGLNVTVVEMRGGRGPCVAEFLAKNMGLNVIQCSAEEHDEQMAYVQGLTHMIAKVFQMMDMPAITQETKTFSYLRQMVDIVKGDSDALFRAIRTDNPFVGTTKQKFFDSVKELEKKLASFSDK